MNERLKISTFDKELLAIVTALSEWRHYTEFAKNGVEVRSDHRNLIGFRQMLITNSRRARWAEFLDRFQINLVFVKGIDNTAADYLSRPPGIQSLKHSKEFLFPNLASLKAVVIPSDMREKLFKAHDHPLAGHRDATVTVENLRAMNVDVPGLKKLSNDYVKSCSLCAKNKVARHLPHGFLLSLKRAPGPGTHWTMDALGGLPLSNGYKYLLFLVDRFSKFLYIRKCISTPTIIDAKELVGHAIRFHGGPVEVLTDRASIFTSNYWNLYLTSIGAKRVLTSAYHPQSDGQSERTIQTIIGYLRLYSNCRGTDWSDHVENAVISYNNSWHSSTGFAPSILAFGDYLNEKGEPPIGAFPSRANILTAKDNLELTTERVRKAADKKRLEQPVYHVNDFVYLCSKNIRSSIGRLRKLEARYLGPFQIIELIGTRAVRLQLPNYLSRIHDVFHVSLIKPVVFRWFREADGRIWHNVNGRIKLVPQDIVNSVI